MLGGHDSSKCLMGDNKAVVLSLWYPWGAAMLSQRVHEDLNKYYDLNL